MQLRPHKRIGIATYALVDWLAAALAWTLLFCYRKTTIEGYEFSELAGQFNNRFVFGIILIPICWVVLYAVIGTYADIYRKSRLSELWRTFVASVIGTVALFFPVLLDDFVRSYTDYYLIFLVLAGSHFLLTGIGRMLVLTGAKHKLERGQIGYTAIIIGSDRRAVQIYDEITSSPRSMAYKIMGYIETNGAHKSGLAKHLPCLGHLDDLPALLDQHNFDEVIIAIESSEHGRLKSLLDRLTNYRVIIKIIPDIYDILSGSVKIKDVLGAVLIEIDPDLMPRWQKVFKRAFDASVSAVVLVLLMPLLAFLAIRVRLSSRGPIFYKQERIGKHGRPFKIYKFRSMYVDAEAKGPALSSENDTRITPWGRVMRKWRLDELPQFWNILKGEMSLVGPRPERQHFIDQIVAEAPSYRHLHKVKPGLTSWGMVKFGYAENVKEMIERMRYDLLYIENMSLAIDFKIMIYTVLTILQGKGK